jgi:lipopolysaccharide/colanic/teichoic acid biosynthesis glycosyltransferase
MRRFVDIVAAGIGLIVLSPLFLVLAIWIKRDSPGPVFYRAQRIGRNGIPFGLYKFRSMVVGADKAGPGITIAGDQRVTPSGRILRKYKLDELPQLINVVKGDMSLVGPRPEAPQYVALYDNRQRAVLSVRPGITSPASLHYRDEESLLQGQEWEQLYTGQIMPHKLEIELTYLQQRTLATDVQLILQTIGALAK